MPKPVAPGAVHSAAAPPVAESAISTLINKTGSWKYILPEYHDKVAPCNAACPAGIDVQGYMLLLQQGELQTALQLLVRENPMPAITGRACDHPCEGACNRRHFDESVSIRGVERMLGDLDLAGPTPDPLPRTHAEHVAIVGSGPAGLSCAVQLVRLGYGVTVLEAADKPGGLLRLGIPAYRLPPAVLDRQIQRYLDLGIEIRCGVRLGDDMEWSELEEFDAVLIATGAHAGRSLDVPGEDLPGVDSGLEFLKAVNGGARPDLGRRVVIVGGGNTAMDCARSAMRLGAEPTVLYRRTRNEMPAIPEEINEAEREGVDFIFLAAPAAFHASDGALVGVECVRMELGPPGDDGRRRPVPTDEGQFTLLADTVLAATGEDAEMGILPPEVTENPWNVDTGSYGTTQVPRFFAAGDLAGEDRTVAFAIGSGKRAALGIHQYLRQQAGESCSLPTPSSLAHGGGTNINLTRLLDDDPVHRNAPLEEVIQYEELQLAYFTPAPRHAPPALPPEKARRSFDEVHAGLSKPAALAEAGRCFTCGLCNNCEICLIFCPDVAITRAKDGGGLRIDLDYCKGCSLCAAECPRGAITMTREKR